MALLTPEQIKQLQTIVNDASTAVAVAAADHDISDEDLQRLIDEGYIDPEQAHNVVLDSFTFGHLMQQLPAAKEMSYAQFTEYLRKNPRPLSAAEREAYDIARTRAGLFTVGLSDTMRGAIATETARTISERGTVGQLKTRLSQASQDWSRDWDRIAATETQLAHQEGFFQATVAKHGDDELLAKIPEPDACEHCKKHYLGSDGLPIVKPASWWEKQGVSNVGRKTADWKPVLGAMHPWCRCQLVRVPAGMVFDEDMDLVPEETEIAKSATSVLLRKAEKLPGGKGDDRPDSAFNAEQLGEGIEHELEHTTDRAVAKEIAKDHLTEDGDYYRKLKTIEKAGPYIGPRGGKWADAAHKIPWKEAAPKKLTAAQKKALDYIRAQPNHEVHGEVHSFYGTRKVGPITASTLYALGRLGLIEATRVGEPVVSKLRTAAGGTSAKEIEVKVFPYRYRLTQPALQKATQLGLFNQPRKAAAWQPIPSGKRGGQRRRQGGRWVYRYPKASKAKAPTLGDDYTGTLIKPGMSIAQTENAIRNAPVEHLGLFSGAKLYHRIKGQAHYVDIPPDVISDVRKRGDVVLTHNHPSGMTLSSDDVMLAIGANLREIRAAAPDGSTWLLQRRGRSWGMTFGEVPGATSLPNALRILESKASDLARQRMDKRIQAAGGQAGDSSHPSFSVELFNEFCSETRTKAFNEFLEASGSKIEKISAAVAEARDQVGQATTDLPRRGVDPKVLTPEFKSWFGDWEAGKGSKVVKEDGTPAEQYGEEPRTVYHGTPAGGFRSFSKDKDKGHNIFGKGFYFTEDRGIAEEYTKKDEEDVLASTTGFMGPTGEITHLNATQAAELRAAVIESSNPNWDPNSAWAITAATGNDGSVDLKKLLSEFWAPTGTPEEHGKAVNSFGLTGQAGRHYDSDQLKGAAGSPDHYNATGGVKLAEKTLQALGGTIVEEVRADGSGWAKTHSVIADDSPVKAIYPQSQVFEVYLNVRKPIDMDAPADFEQVRRMSRHMTLRREARRNKTDLSPTDEQMQSAAPFVEHIKDTNDLVDFNALGLSVDGDDHSLEITPENLLKLKRAVVDATKGEMYNDRQVAGALHISDRDTLTWGDVHYLSSDMGRWQSTRESFTEWAKFDGHDGIHHTGGYNIGTHNHDVWIAFEPNQIKATSSDKFDPSTDDIYKATLQKARKLHGRMKFQGFNISIENRAGSSRRWYDVETETHGETKMAHPYGYIRMTEGVDGDHVDCFIGPNEDAKSVYVVHQLKAPHFKEFDEDKCMMGFRSASAAKQAYLEHYDRPDFFGSMTTLSVEQFRKKVYARKRQMIKADKSGQMTFGGWEAAPHSKKGAQRRKRGKGYEYRYQVPEHAETKRAVFDHEQLAAVTTVFINVSGGSERKQFVPRAGATGTDIARKNVAAQITAHEVPKSERGRERFAAVARDKGMQLMIDSGEFGRFGRELKARKANTPIPELDFDAVFDNYEAMAEQMPPGTLTVVAPDRIADPEKTAELRAQYADRVRGLLEQDVEVIVPIQARSAEEIGQDYIRATEVFGEHITLGFPTAAAVLPMDQILPALTELYVHGRFPKVHFLGGGRPREMAERTAQLTAAAYFAGVGVSSAEVLELTKTPALAARALRNVKTGDVLLTAASEHALGDRMHDWAREHGMDPSHEDFDETEAWPAFFDAHPAEFNTQLDSREDKAKLFRQMASDLVQMDSRVVGSLQQYGLQHHPITGTQIPAGEHITALPKKDRHPATLQAYLEAREHQTERFVPPAMSAWESLWGEFEKSRSFLAYSMRQANGDGVRFWKSAIEAVGLDLSQFALVVKYAQQGHSQARAMLDRVYDVMAKANAGEVFPSKELAAIGTMGHQGKPARTANANWRAGEAHREWPQGRRRRGFKKRKVVDEDEDANKTGETRETLTKPSARLDVMGRGRSAGMHVHDHDWEQIQQWQSDTRTQGAEESKESLYAQQRGRVELRESSKLTDLEGHK